MGILPLSVSTTPSAILALNLARSGPKSQRLAMAPRVRKPRLWRLCAYFASGLPRPTRISMALRPRSDAGGLFRLGFRFFLGRGGGGGLIGLFRLHGRGGGDRGHGGVTIVRR